MRRTILYILFILLFQPQFLGANQTDFQDVPRPRSPVEPGDPDKKERLKQTGNDSRDENEPAGKNSKKQKQRKKIKILKVQVSVILGSNDEIEGFISIPSSFSFQHYKNGLVYNKDILARELQSIKILSYRRVSQSDVDDGSFEEYEPAQVKITLKDNSVYYLDSIFPALRAFDIETTEGRTRLYTYFADTLGKAGWQYVHSDDPEYHIKNPHPAAAQTIRF